jgi:ceramide glucosyltransferase
VLIAGPPPAGRTGKLNAMIVGAQAARGELIAFGDSDTRPDRHVLRVLVETLVASPGAGDAFAPVVVGDRPHTAGDLGYALLINSLYGPAVALAAHGRGDVPFIMGQLMVFRREALSAIGGLACADGQLVDDMYLGARVALAGYRNLMSSHPLAIAVGGMRAREFARLFHRWLTFSRAGLPRAFTWPLWLRGLEFWVALGAAMGSCWVGHPWAALVPASALVASSASLARLGRLFGGAPVALRQAWAPSALFLLAPVMLVATLLGRQVSWRGRAYALDAEARLA